MPLLLLWPAPGPYPAPVVFHQRDADEILLALSDALAGQVFDQNIVPNADTRANIEGTKLAGVTPLVHSNLREFFVEDFTDAGSNLLRSPVNFDFGDISSLSPCDDWANI
jgi:hypothetical protein